MKFADEGKERREYWANLDTPNKAVEASLKTLDVFQHLSPNEIKTAPDWIVGGLRNAGFNVLNDVVINQVLVSFGPEEVTQEVIRRVQQDGTCWCGGTI